MRKHLHTTIVYPVDKYVDKQPNRSSLTVLQDKLKTMNKKYFAVFMLGALVSISGQVFAQEVDINLDTVKKLLAVIKPIYEENQELKTKVAFLENEIEKKDNNICEIAVGQVIEKQVVVPQVNPVLVQKKARLNELLNQQSTLRAESKQIEDFIKNMFDTEGYTSGTRDIAQQKNVRQIEITNIMPKIVNEINQLQAEIAAM